MRQFILNGVLQNNLPSGVIKATTHFFKDVLVQQGAFKRRLGMNIIIPKRTLDIVGQGPNNIPDARLHLHLYRPVSI